MGTKRVAIITGVTGIQGRTLARKLGESQDWEKVYGISRHKLESKEYEHVKQLSLDLSEKQAVHDSLKEAGIKDVTHLFHVAFSGDMSNMDTSQVKLMTNVVEALEDNGNKLEHVYFTQGLKYYGCHLGHDYETPFREDQPRHVPPNFYYDYEDYAMKRKKDGASWNWSTLRPGCIMGFAPRVYMSLFQCIALYGTVCRELGLPLRFPGTVECYNAVWECVDVELLTDAEIWLATHDEAANQAYNISNGDTFRWRQVWPKIAAWFGIPEGPLLSQPLDKLMQTPDKEALWNELVKKHGLKQIPYKDMAQWEFMDMSLQMPDNFSVVTKLARAGFPGLKLDTDAMFVEKLQSLAEQKIIPAYGKGG